MNVIGRMDECEWTKGEWVNGRMGEWVNGGLYQRCTTCTAPPFYTPPVTCSMGPLYASPSPTPSPASLMNPVTTATARRSNTCRLDTKCTQCAVCVCNSKRSSNALQVSRGRISCCASRTSYFILVFLIPLFYYSFTLLFRYSSPETVLSRALFYSYFTTMHSTALLLYCSTALLLYCSTALLLYCSTTLLLYCSTALLRYCSTALLPYCSHLEQETRHRLRPHEAEGGGIVFRPPVLIGYRAIVHVPWVTIPTLIVPTGVMVRPLTVIDVHLVVEMVEWWWRW
jgi:hypothetical protein